MTKHTLSETREQLWRAEVAVVELLRDRLSDACPLNCAYLNEAGETWGDAPTYFSADIHVPVAPTDETSCAAIEALDEALGDARYIFQDFLITPDVVIVSDGSDLYARHGIRFEVRPNWEPDEDLF